MSETENRTPPWQRPAALQAALEAMRDRGWIEDEHLSLDPALAEKLDAAVQLDAPAFPRSHAWTSTEALFARAVVQEYCLLFQAHDAAQETLNDKRPKAADGCVGEFEAMDETIRTASAAISRQAWDILTQRGLSEDPYSTEEAKRFLGSIRNASCAFYKAAAPHDWDTIRELPVFPRSLEVLAKEGKNSCCERCEGVSR